MTKNKSEKCQGSDMMRRDILVESLEWDGILIEVAFEADWLGSSPRLGFQMAHLEVRRLAPEKAELPITQTGYRSHFLPKAEVLEAGGPLAYVRDWLQEAASDPEWIKRQEAARQFSLF